MPLALLLLTAAFEALPNDLEDAAKLEGCRCGSGCAGCCSP